MDFSILDEIIEMSKILLLHTINKILLTPLLKNSIY